MLTHCCRVQCQVALTRSFISVAPIWKSEKTKHKVSRKCTWWSFAFILPLVTFEALYARLNPNRSTVCVFCVLLFRFALKLTKHVPAALYRIYTVVSSVLFCCGILTCVWLIDDRADTAWHLSYNDRWTAAILDKWPCLFPIEALAQSTHNSNQHPTRTLVCP